MIHPVIFVVVADVAMRTNITRDLERRFGADYRVMAVDSATAGLARLEVMRQSGDEVAVIITAIELPEMSGFALLNRADDLHPETQRGLLVTPGPTGMTASVRRAILLNHVDFLISAPWVQAEESLYPPVTEALSQWVRRHRPHDEGITLIGELWSTRGHELRDILDRSGVPYGFYAVDSDHGRELIARHQLPVDRLPIAIHRSGRVAFNPTNEELAEVIGVATQPPTTPVDVTIIGAGPSGLAAAVYGASEGLRTVVVESGALGGQAAASHQILNYLGFPRGVSGRELTNRAYMQALLFGTYFIFARHVVDMEPRGKSFLLTFDNGSRLVSRTVIVASGVAPRHLGIPTLEALIGRGVFYGATGAEAAALHDEKVCVVGGGNAAAQAALHLAEYAERVTLIIRGESLGSEMSSYLVQRIAIANNIDVRLNTQVVDCTGQRRLRGLVLEERTSGVRETLPAAALFVDIGGQPDTSWLPDSIVRDEAGHILTGRELANGSQAWWPLERLPLPLETSMPGVFAAGDVRRGAAQRVAPAVGDGAVAIRAIHEYQGPRETAERPAGELVGAAPRGAS